MLPPGVLLYQLARLVTRCHNAVVQVSARRAVLAPLVVRWRRSREFTGARKFDPSLYISNCSMYMYFRYWSSWVSGMIIPIYKNRGDRNNLNNYRGITILGCLGKLFTSLINVRITDFVDNLDLIRPEQAGLRKSYSAIDHIYTLKSLIDIYLSKKQKLYCAFIYYKKSL